MLFRSAKLEERDMMKDTLISYWEEKDSTNQFIIGQKDSQITQYRDMSIKLENELKTKNEKFKWYRRGTFLGLVSTVILLIVI